MTKKPASLGGFLRAPGQLAYSLKFVNRDTVPAAGGYVTRALLPSESAPPFRPHSPYHHFAPLAAFAPGHFRPAVSVAIKPGPGFGAIDSPYGLCYHRSRSPIPAPEFNVSSCAARFQMQREHTQRPPGRRSRPEHSPGTAWLPINGLEQGAG